jgi:hypothetical protein
MKRIGLLVLAIALFISAYAANPEKPKTTVPITATMKVEATDSPKEVSQSVKDSIVYSKLSAEEIFALKKMEMEAGQPPKLPLPSIIVLLICALPFLFAGTIIFINVKAKKDESKRRYDLYAKSLEMGQTIPEHFFDEPKKANPSSNLKKGILWFVIGAAIFISLLVMHEKDGLILGIVPTFVGIGYLLVHFLEKPKPDSTVNNDEQHG